MKRYLAVLTILAALAASSFGQTNRIDINEQTAAFALTDTGAANAYVVTDAAMGASYYAGMPVIFTAAHSNTGASTINVNSLGAKTIKKQGGTADVASGDIQSGAVILLVYDGTNFQMQSQTGNATGGSITINGATCTVGSSCAPYGGVVTYTANHTIGAADIGKLVVMNCSSACTLTFKASPAATDWWWMTSIGSTVTTVSLNSLNFNGSSSIPVLISFMPLVVHSDGSNYFGDSPLIGGSNITLTPGSNGLTVALASSPALAGNPTAATQICTDNSTKLATTAYVNNCAAAGGASSVLLQTNGTNNGSQAKLNLQGQQGVKTTDNGSGTVTISLKAPITFDIPPASAGSLDDEFNGASLDLTRWTWVNQGSATATEGNGMLALSTTSSTDTTNYIYQTAPSTPWEVTTKMMIPVGFFSTSMNFFAFGVVIADSTKECQIGIRPGNAIYFNYTGSGAFVSQQTMSSMTTFYQYIYMKVKDDGTNIIVSFSYDGFVWIQYDNPLVSRTAFLPSGPTRVGLFIDGNGGATSPFQSVGIFDWFRRTL